MWSWGIASVLLVVWGVLWMVRVGRTGPRVLNALAELVVILTAFPIGLLVWSALRRRSDS